MHDIVYGGLRTNDDHHEEDWERDVRVEDLIEAIRLPAQQDLAALSGGLKRRPCIFKLRHPQAEGGGTVCHCEKYAKRTTKQSR